MPAFPNRMVDFQKNSYGVLNTMQGKAGNFICMHIAYTGAIQSALQSNKNIAKVKDLQSKSVKVQTRDQRDEGLKK